MGTIPLMSTAFHPQTNGVMEQAAVLLVKFWEQSSKTTRRIGKLNVQWLSSCWTAMSVMGFAPFKLNHGYVPNIGWPWSKVSSNSLYKQGGISWLPMMQSSSIVLDRCFKQTRNVRVVMNTRWATAYKYQCRTWPCWKEGPESQSPNTLCLTLSCEGL